MKNHKKIEESTNVKLKIINSNVKNVKVSVKLECRTKIKWKVKIYFLKGVRRKNIDKN